MEHGDNIYIGEPIPKIEMLEHKDFLLNFQKVMLQSMVNRKLLTAAQMDQVMVIIAKKSNIK